MKKGIFAVLFLCMALAASAQKSTVHDVLLQIQRAYKVHFIYASGLDLSVPCRGTNSMGKPLAEVLESVFLENGFEYVMHGNNILLRKKAVKPRYYRVTGTVADSTGEKLVNVSVYDRETKTGTLTDERGRYVLLLPQGRHCLSATYFGSVEKDRPVDLNRDLSVDFVLKNPLQISEIVVTGDMNSPVLTTQTGKRSLTGSDIKTEFSLLSSPDLIKTLQRTSGVSSGTELASGLFVHGGNADENLFLIDGSPIYQTNHSLGLFSAFNVDMIKNVDFYKSGFPARYSGRISSITDVRTRDGDMNQMHGTFSVGLIDGRFQLEGPIVKGKTSYNLALRRSWIDLLLGPAYAIINRGMDDGERFSFHYAFHDFNMKITHRLNKFNKLWLSLYTGGDNYGIKDESSYDRYLTTTRNRFRWGNLNGTLGGDFQLSGNLWLSSAIVSTFSYSRHNMDEDETCRADNDLVYRNSLDMRSNRTRMHDLGLKNDFRFTALRNHDIRFGLAVTHHGFHPQTTDQTFLHGDPSESVDTSRVSTRTQASSDEVTAYVEDEMRLANWLSTHIGTSYTWFQVRGKCYQLLDPRLVLKWQIADNWSLKMSYTHMSQSIHRISSSFLDIPSDFWVPTTANVRPTKSHQIAGGIYARLNKDWTVTLEGFHKRSRHLLQYRHWMGLQPPAALWESNVTEGEGESYGLEFDAVYRGNRIRANASYTLSFSNRKFTEIYEGWFRDPFDNRHAIDLSARYKISKRVSAFGAFILRSGNRMTLPVAYAVMPDLPGDHVESKSGFVYDKPNNFALPVYHRLDIGFDFSHKTKKGREAIWNLSLYNAYCHPNAMYAKVRKNEETGFEINAKGFIPVIPSVSYTLKF